MLNLENDVNQIVTQIVSANYRAWILSENNENEIALIKDEN